MSTEAKIISRESVSYLPDGLVLSLSIFQDVNLKKHQSEKNELLSKTLSKASEALNLTYSDLKIEKDISGKPNLRVSNEINIGISITHSNELFICGLNMHGEIGIDTEKIDRIHHKGLLKRIIHEEEIISDYKSVIHLWTLKEAILKLMGTGLRTNMNELNIIPESEHIFKVIHDKYNLSIVSFEYRNHWISVAYT
jgi:phosphopantetheinyl transferase